MWNSRWDENEAIEATSLTKTHLRMRIAISTDERFLAAARERRFLAKEYKVHAIQVWDRTTRKRVFTVEETALNIKGLDFSPDSKTLAYADSSDIVRLWDIENNSLQFKFEPVVPLSVDHTFIPGIPKLSSTTVQCDWKLYPNLIIQLP